MAGRYLFRAWVACAALLALSASPALSADDDNNGNNGKSKLKGTYTFRLVPATSFAPFLPLISGVDTAPRQDILRVGVFTADGNGNLTGRTIATTDDGASTIKIDFTWTGTYTLDAQGLGQISITAPGPGNILSCVDGNDLPVLVPTCDTFEGAERFAIVVNAHGDDKLVSMIQTDNAGGGAKIFLTGDAKRR